MLVCMKVRQDHRAEIKAKLRSMNPMTVRLTKGQILNYMMFGHGVLADVNVQIPGGQLALLYELDVDGVHYVFYLPLECWNWARALVQSAPPPPSPCPHYRQQVKKGDLVVLAVTGPHGLPGGACKPRIRVAGTGVFVSPDTLPICLRSYGLDCDLSAAARMAGGAIQHQVAYRAEADGVTTLEVDPIIATSGSGYAIVTCLVRKGESSCGVITKPKHYRFDQRRKAKVATVYEPENLPERLLRSHWDQYWRKSTHGCPVRPD